LITDVPGILVGQAEDQAGIGGTTVVLAEEAAAASVDVRGGAPGSRETELLAAGTLVNCIDAVVLSGGSAFGLDAAAGVMDRLAEAGRGFLVGSAIVPIVPAPARSATATKSSSSSVSRSPATRWCCCSTSRPPACRRVKRTRRCSSCSASPASAA
jgi:L-aminopeptidase/D-esterase-like protein